MTAPSDLRVPSPRTATIPRSPGLTALVDQPWTWRPRCGEGRSLLVRPATAEDLPAMARLLGACSPTTRLGWWGHGGILPSLAAQEAWLRRPGSVVVRSDRGRLLVALAGWEPHPLGPGGTPAALADVLVHDAWQGRGLGDALVRHVAAAAVAADRYELGPRPGVDAAAATALLGRVGPALQRVGARGGARGWVRLRRERLCGLGALAGDALLS